MVQLCLAIKDFIEQFQFVSVPYREFVIDCFHHIIQLMHVTTLLRDLVEMQQGLFLLTLDALELNY
jgi:hypothetical protein